MAAERASQHPMYSAARADCHASSLRDMNGQAVTGLRTFIAPVISEVRASWFLADRALYFTVVDVVQALSSQDSSISRVHIHTTRSFVRRVGPNQQERTAIAIMSYGYIPDEENGLGAALFDKSGPSIEFAEQEVRLGFIRKVFGE